VNATMTTSGTAETARQPVMRTVSADGGEAHAIPVDPPAAAVIGSYRDGGERRELAVEPVGDGAWTVTDRALGPGREPVEIETLARYLDDPLAEAVALAADYLEVVDRDPSRRVR